METGKLKNSVDGNRKIKKNRGKLKKMEIFGG
jgi:hypothetical protein